MKTNKFEVQKIKKNVITVAEEKDDLKSPFLLFFKSYGTIIQAILLFVAILTFTIGISLSLAQAYKNATEKHEVIYTVTFNNRNQVTLNDAYPMSDEQAIDFFTNEKTDQYGNKYVPNKLSLRNDSANDLSYIIAIEEDNALALDRLRPNVIKYRAYNSTFDESGILASKVMLDEIMDYQTNNLIVPSNNYVIARGTLEVGKEIDYNLMLWISGIDTTNEDQAKVFSGTIKVYVDYIED